MVLPNLKSVILSTVGNNSDYTFNDQFIFWNALDLRRISRHAENGMMSGGLNEKKA